MLKPRFSHKSPSNSGARGKQRNPFELDHSLGLLYKGSAKNRTGLAVVGVENGSERDGKEEADYKTSQAAK